MSAGLDFASIRGPSVVKIAAAVPPQSFNLTAMSRLEGRPPVSLGGRAVGWPASEVTALNAARISGKSNEEFRDLVAELGSGSQDGQVTGFVQLAETVRAVSSNHPGGYF